MHTARRTTASIRQGLDDDVALGGDLVTEIDGSRLRERRLLYRLTFAPCSPRRCSIRSRNTLPRGLEMSSNPTVKPSSEAGRAGGPAGAGLRSLVGSRTVRVIPSVLHRPGDRSRPDVAVRPPADDRGEQTGPAAGVCEEQSTLAELGHRRCVGEVFRGIGSNHRFGHGMSRDFSRFVESLLPWLEDSRVSAKEPIKLMGTKETDIEASFDSSKGGRIVFARSL